MEKSKTLITRVLIIMILLAQILIVPSKICSSYFPKLLVLMFLGLFLLVLILKNYKYLEIDKKDVLILFFLVLVYISTIFSSNIIILIVLLSYYTLL